MIADKIKEVTSSTKKEVKKQGITLTIPVEGGYLSRDIAECTTEEFLAWARVVYPFIDESQLHPSDFDKVDQRIRALKQIEDFHKQTLFSVKKDEKLGH